MLSNENDISDRGKATWVIKARAEQKDWARLKFSNIKMTTFD